VVCARAQMTLMQDWANYGGGFYSLFASPGEAETALRRIAARLRAPAADTQSYSVATRPLPPGLLSVAAPQQLTAAGTPAAAGGAIALVLDASGSMLQRLNDERKINLAKRMLTRLVEQVLPPGLPLALRVFGQGGKGSCRSDLVLPLAPLDATAAAAAIAAIRSTNGAKTPIAESLRLAAQDLAASPGAKRIVLVTDGEETCGGDPQNEITRLRAAGIDLRLNIVGFDVGDAAVRSQFEDWATAGGGRYFDAAGAADLETALQDAVQTPFRVIDAAGTLVAQGTVGGPALSIPAGSYRVQVEAQPEIVFDNVEIRSEETTALVLRP
jgi:Mg-chelatase subunit ChlD